MRLVQDLIIFRATISCTGNVCLVPVSI